MDLYLFTQYLINGLIAGSIYALVASGFSLIFSTNRFMHFAHGHVMVLGGYLFYSFFVTFHWPLWIAALLAVILTGLVGSLLFVFIYKPLIKRKASNVVLLIASIALISLLQNGIQLAYGSGTKALNERVLDGSLTIFEARITYVQILIFFMSFILLILLSLLLKKTRLGKEIRAVSDNPELASIIGIAAFRVKTLSFFIGSALAGIGGVFIVLEQSLKPTMGTPYVVKGFTSAVIGGLDFVPGSIVGSYFLGLVENLGILFLPSGLKEAIAFALLFVFLLFRPQGFFGIQKGIKK